MRTIEEFIENLNNDDVDLINKLDNLHGHGQISDKVCELCYDDDCFEIIEYYVKEILKDDIKDPELNKGYISFIVAVTQNLYEQGLIDKADDFSSGLYDCDEVYLYAISDALDINVDELEDYESEDE